MVKWAQTFHHASLLRPSIFTTQFLSTISAHCEDMGHCSPELLSLATGAIDRALPLLQDPVLMSARHLPPATCVYEQLGKCLLYLSTGPHLEASGSDEIRLELGLLFYLGTMVGLCKFMLIHASSLKSLLVCTFAL